MSDRTSGTRRVGGEYNTAVPMLAATSWGLLIAGAAALGAIVLGWALFWDRSRGRRRCPGCWYDMAGAALTERGGARVFVCPECGRVTATERGLGRTRRRWGAVWALVAIAMIVWWAPAAVRRVRARGVVGLVPTTGLVVLVSGTEGDETEAPGVWADELRTRCERGDLQGWQLRVLCARTLRLSCRARVPAGMDVLMEARGMEWLLGSVVLEFSREGRGAQEWRAGEAHNLGPIGPGDRGIGVHVLAETVGGECTCAFQRRLEVEAVAGVAEAVMPVVGADIDARVRRALAVSVRSAVRSVEYGAARFGEAVVVTLDPTFDEELREIAFPLSVEFCREGRVVASYSLRLRPKWQVEDRAWLDADGAAPSWAADDGAELALWTVRIRGEPSRGMEDARRERCWAGEIELALQEVLERERP